MAGEIFISYRRADRAWAQKLHSQLKAEGVEAWYDAHVGAGEDWRIATAKALQASRIFVLLFSESAAESSDIAKELAAAVLEKKLIIPVRLQDIAPSGAFLYELASRNWINAYEDTEAKLAELAKGLAHLVQTGGRDEGVLPFERADGGKHGQRKWPFIAAAAACVLLVAATAAAWLLWPERKWTVEKSRPFISSLALEDFPAFSPNGAMLAYTSEPEGGAREIYVRNLSGGEGIKITNDSTDDISPTWSSDGTRLAYSATKAGEPCHIMVVTVPAGQVREAGRCAQADFSLIAWQPGTSFVYGTEYSGLKGSLIYRLDLDTGARQVIVAKPALRDTISSLHCSPDGKWLAYLFQRRQIVLRDLKSGREKIFGAVSQNAAFSPWLAWTEDSGTILTAISSTVGGSEIVGYPLSGKEAYSVYTTPTKVLNFATGGGLLALGTDISRSSLARASASPSTQPDIIESAGGLTWSPDFASDGTLFFLSNRTGTNAIWQILPGAAPKILMDGGLSPMHRIRLSPDGAMLAVAIESPQGVIVKIMTRAGATISQFAPSSRGIGLPNWTADGKALLLFDRRTLRTMRVPDGNVAKQTPFAPPHFVGVADRKNGTFATRADKPGIWRIDNGIKQINSDYPRYYDPPLAFRGDDVLVPQFESGDAPSIRAQPVTGGPSRVIAFAPGAAKRSDFSSDLAVNPATGEIVYVALVSHDTNIDLLTLVRH